ncbi:MAG: hypothetical protein LAO21_18780 [Acidobacteriia bacterium]|nr:hypothetical protein [Terriglobia bacterium]
MKSWQKGLLLAALHLGIVLSLGAKLLIDRANLPRVWAKTVPVDPDLPIRGRYVSLRLEVDGSQMPVAPNPKHPAGVVEFTPYYAGLERVRLTIENGQLAAVPASQNTGVRARKRKSEDSPLVTLQDPIAFYIPEHALDPSRRLKGEELWVEVTVPRKGPPRPIQLGVKKDGVISPLPIH